MKIVNENGQLINIKYFEKEEQDLARTYVLEDDVVLELGARYGSVSCTINNNLGIKTNQVVVEPDERVWEALEINKKANNCHFHIIKGFISYKKLNLTDKSSHLGCGTSTIEDSNTTIPSYSLSEIKNKYKLNFNVLIADCEGFLEMFYDENTNFFDSLRLVIFECDRPDKCNYNKIKTSLTNKGFTNLLDSFQNVWINTSI
jgi:FkbM family methyltransferase